MKTIKVFRCHGDAERVVMFDVTDKTTRRAIIKETKERLGLIGVVCNNQHFDHSIVMKPINKNERIVIDLDYIER